MLGTTNISDMYMSILASLSNNDKLALISKLSASMHDGISEERVRPNLRTCFSGNWDNVDADELRNHEYEGRQIENW